MIEQKTPGVNARGKSAPNATGQRTQADLTAPQLRSFGFTVGGIFALIALWPAVIRSQQPRWWALVTAACLLIPAVVFPQALFWPHRGWSALGHGMGWINTRIILGLVFYLIVTPMGVVRRWLGKDPMGKRLRPDLGSYRVSRQPRPPSHLKRQY